LRGAHGIFTGTSSSSSPPTEPARASGGCHGSGRIARGGRTGGRLGPRELAGQDGRRSRLDLPLRTNETMGTHWLTRMGGAASVAGCSRVAAGDCDQHDCRCSSRCGQVAVYGGLHGHRGAAGIGWGRFVMWPVGLDPMSHVLVAPAHSYTREPLGSILEGLAACSADAVVHTTREGGANGVLSDPLRGAGGVAAARVCGSQGAGAAAACSQV
jgi:hypothetical protein